LVLVSVNDEIACVMTPEAALDSLRLLREAAERAITDRAKGRPAWWALVSRNSCL